MNTVVSESRKLFSLRSTWVYLAIVALGMTGFIRRNLPWPSRFGILVAGLLVVSPGVPVTLVGLALGGALYGLELYRTRHLPDFVVNTEGMQPMGQNRKRSMEV